MESHSAAEFISSGLLLLREILASELIIARGSPVRAAALASAANSLFRDWYKAANNTVSGTSMAIIRPPGKESNIPFTGVPNRTIANASAVH